MTTTQTRLIRGCVASLGALFFLFPFGFRWYVSDAGRYAALLRGPAPWSYTGNLAYQLLGAILAPALLAVAALLVVLALRDQSHFDHAPLTRRAIILQVIAVVIVVCTIATVLVVFRTPPTDLG